MSTTSSFLRSRLLNLAHRWPKDPLRGPRGQFRNELQRFHKELTWVEENPSLVKKSEKKWDEEGMLNALERLMKNQAYKRYPTPPSILHPATSPQYFERLVVAFKEGRESYDRGNPVEMKDYLKRGGLFGWISRRFKRS